MSAQNTESTQLSKVDTKDEIVTLDNVEEKETFKSLEEFANIKFELPTKRIANGSHIAIFLQSAAFTKLDTFIQDLATAVEGKKISDECHISSTVTKVLSLLDALNKLVDDTPPIEQPSRYGNKAYRKWHDELSKISKKLLISILPDSWQDESISNTNPNIQTTLTKKENNIVFKPLSKNTNTAPKEEIDSKTSEKRTNNGSRDGLISELNGYLLSSFGDYTRIDYGTGHELTFLCFLVILKELSLFNSNDYGAIVLRIFHKYLLLMRKIQCTYFLEPAGSRGVWGLDDYQFLVFYFGASQLINHKSILPKDILNRTILKIMSHEYLYLESISFILKMKTGMFAEHSPLLNDITGVPIWAKVKSGLYLMYTDDVFKKFPVIQHFLFGGILSIDLLPGSQSNDKDDAIMQRKLALIKKLNKDRGVSNDRSNLVSPETSMQTQSHFGTKARGSGGFGTGGMDVNDINSSMSVHYAAATSMSNSHNSNQNKDIQTGSISALRQFHTTPHDSNIGSSQSQPISLTSAPWATGKKTTAVVGPPISKGDSTHVVTKAPWA